MNTKRLIAQSAFVIALVVALQVGWQFIQLGRLPALSEIDWGLIALVLVISAISFYINATAQNKKR
jgi:hypothetical protein